MHFHCGFSLLFVKFAKLAMLMFLTLFMDSNNYILLDGTQTYLIYQSHFCKMYDGS